MTANDVMWERIARVQSEPAASDHSAERSEAGGSKFQLVRGK
jgi:hypothetical protein